MGSELLMVTIVGMGVVFGVLILLALIIMGFKYVFYKEPEKETVKEVSAINNLEKEKANDEELVAVIAAAIASSNPGMRFVVRNIVRIPDTSPAWGRMARQEQINRISGR
ncbi:OadG family protein [Calorimonas adulescens]|uniref:OadG family protein n=1 Tax=Calorimonas adulescens TaxID=2606906 RepID=UPI0013968128|nr:OadG family protein [Calorimonas adulescens]